MSVVRSSARLLLGALAVVLLVAPPGLGSAAPGPGRARVQPGEVLVELRSGASADRVAARAGAGQAAVTRGSIAKLEVARGRERARAEQLRTDPDVVAAAPNYVRRALDVTPNDPGYTQQWHLPQIRAPAAWDQTTGSPSVKVAILDSGVDLAHPDLVANLLPGTNLLCSDQTWTPPTPTYCATATAQDDFGHGTHVAGITGAAGNNALGVSGVNWRVGIVPVKVLDATGSGTDAQIIAGIDWAIADGANVINLSIGGPGQSGVLDAAVRRAWDAGIVVVTAAGNAGSSEPFYPAASPGSLAVGATDTFDRASGYSNYGPHLAIAAPGDNIYSTLPLAQGAYGVKTGTSMSAPVVAGAAALGRALRPGLDNWHVVGALLASADKVGNYPYDATGRNQHLGYGRLNAAAALATALRDPVPLVILPTLRPRTLLPIVPRYGPLLPG